MFRIRDTDIAWIWGGGSKMNLWELSYRDQPNICLSGFYTKKKRKTKKKPTKLQPNLFDEQFNQNA